MQPPSRIPIGLDIARTSRSISRAFEEAMAAAGGTLPMWLILVTVKTRHLGNQRELAEVVGIQGATLTHHLNALEADGLLTRRRDPANRRVHLVELTGQGEAMFLQLRSVAISFDEKVRTGFEDTEIASLERFLVRLRDNVGKGEGTRSADTEA